MTKAMESTQSEMRDNGGTGTQQEVCRFLVNLMGMLEDQRQNEIPKELLDLVHDCIKDGYDAGYKDGARSALFAPNRLDKGLGGKV